MLYFKAMLTSIDFYRRLFVHVISVCIIVSWTYKMSYGWLMYCIHIVAGIIVLIYCFNILYLFAFVVLES